MEKNHAIQTVMVRPTELMEESLEKEFATSTTAHGFARAAASKSICRRIAWVVFILAGLGMATWMISLRLINYFTYSTSTEIKITFEPRLAFPAVTICNFNRYMKKFLTTADYYVIQATSASSDYYENYYNNYDGYGSYDYGSSSYSGPSGSSGSSGYSSNSDSTGSSGYSSNLGSTGSSGYPGPSGSVGSLGSTGSSSYPGPSGYAGSTDSTGSTGDTGSYRSTGSYDSSAQSGNDVSSRSATSNGMWANISELYPNGFDFGNFSMEKGWQLTNETVLECEFKGRSCDLDKDFQHVFSSYGNCYTFNGELHARRSRYQDQPGLGNGLHLVLNVEQNEYLDDVPDETEQIGIVFQVHSQYEPPLMETKGLGVSPGFHAFAGLKRLQTVNIEPPWGKCNKSLRLDHYPQYTFSGCIIECKLQKTVEKCACKPLEYPGSYPVCSPREMQECVREEMRVINQDFSKHCSGCTVPCNSTNYNIQLSYVALRNATLHHKYGKHINPSGYSGDYIQYGQSSGA
ncbi:acid-sensing ion channel 2-like [Lingula anatina]|uniref:Acid-sensing ion channel 2-like n=1 Tax=Lingula anatina TaxID=7574 RepID=A0A1S3JJA2_LINAN|nr:acid-sensing ion channel 2-like [Lingula anatina]|eukprot:XP_013410206.1 acid-sensing ion channel 2-like [Lingula anatina]